MNVKKYKDEETHNLSIFIDKFKDDNLRGTLTNSFQIKSSYIYLEDINYKQINENKAVPLDFAAYSGGGSVEDFSILGPDIGLNVKGFYFIDNKGIEVTDFTTDFRYTKNQMQFHNTTLQTPFSKINVALDIHYDSRDPVKFNELIYLEATFIDSHLSTKDLGSIPV